MEIGVFGQWHLGLVTATGLCTKGFKTISFGTDEENCKNIDQGNLPIFEPKMLDLIREGKDKGLLRFSYDKRDLEQLDYFWVCLDTPVNDDDEADEIYVIEEIKKLCPLLKKDCVVIVSSQLPVGSVGKLETWATENYADKNLEFVCIPENLRLGKAVSYFLCPDRFIIGVNGEDGRKKIETIMKQFDTEKVYMSIKAAEMVKHGINSFLATSVCFANELACLCEQNDIDATEVARGIKSDMRIGKYSYLSPGLAFSGGTLARDISYLNKIGVQSHCTIPLLNSIRPSNNHHKSWVITKLKNVLGNIDNKTIAVWGITYKAGTNTLRRSLAVESCKTLHDLGAKIVAYDPLLEVLPPNMDWMELQQNKLILLEKADALVIFTPWKELTKDELEKIQSHLKGHVVVDPTASLCPSKQPKSLSYYSIGRSFEC